MCSWRRKKKVIIEIKRKKNEYSAINETNEVKIIEITYISYSYTT